MGLPSTVMAHLQWLWQRITNGGRLLVKAFGRLGTLSFSLFVTLVVPAIPGGIEIANTGHLSAGTCLIIGIVLCATFIASAEHNGYRTLYGLLTVVCILLDTGVSQLARQAAQKYSVYLLLAAALLHLTERVYWHVVLNRPFPEEQWDSMSSFLFSAVPPLLVIVSVLAAIVSLIQSSVAYRAQERAHKAIMAGAIFDHELQALISHLSENSTLSLEDRLAAVKKIREAIEMMPVEQDKKRVLEGITQSNNAGAMQYITSILSPA